jgi:cell division protein FtsN
VNQLSHDTASLGEDGFHEIHLSGKQLVFLFMAGTVVLVVIFLCGVLVGRGVREQRAGEAGDTSAAVTPASGVTDAGPQAAEPPAPPEETPDELSYHKRLQGSGSQAEQLKPAPPEPAAEPRTRPAAPPPAPAAGAADVQTSGRPGKWVVQVVAFQNRGTAVELVRRLSSRGYPAFLVPPESPSVPQIYRVRVGGYNDPREAEQVSNRIAKEERFKPLVRPR